jgi:hypothetical protein
MDGITYDQLNSVFGDLASKQDKQISAIAELERVIGDRLNILSDTYLRTIKDRLKLISDQFTANATVNEKSAEKVVSSNNELGNSQKEQAKATVLLSKNVTSGLRALQDTFLTKAGSEAVKKKEVQDTAPLMTQQLQLKQQKILIQKITSTDNKMGALLKEVQSQKSDKQGQGSIFKFLTPFLLLFGGITALTYGAMKLPGVRNLFENIKKGGIQNTLLGFVSKIKPQDKTISQWLRGLPFIGRFFDVYDAFKAFTTGRWKEGFKHLAFAIPGAEFISEILGGKGAKQKILAPGGLTSTFKNLSFQQVWDNMKQMVKEKFSSISNTFKHITEVFGLITTGNRDGMVKGFELLSKYFPIFSPISDTLKALTGDVFDSSFAQEAAKGLAPGEKINIGDIVKVAVKNIFEKVKSFFTRIGEIIGQAVDLISCIGDIFSGDYGKQSAALNKLDKISPGVSGMLRTVLNVTDAFNQLHITDEMTLFEKLRVIAKGTAAAVTSDKYSELNTVSKEAEKVRAERATTTDPTELAKLDARERELEDKEQDVYIGITQRAVDKINKRIDEISKNWDNMPESGLKGNREYDRLAAERAELNKSLELLKTGKSNLESQLPSSDKSKTTDSTKVELSSTAKISPLTPVDTASPPSLFENDASSRVFDSMETQLQQMNDRLTQLVTSQKQANDHLGDIRDSTRETSEKDFTLRNTNNNFNSINNSAAVFGANSDSGIRGGRWKLN